jgi:1-acyl-sn-glycerol-3-phosphate acyltransferase
MNVNTSRRAFKSLRIGFLVLLYIVSSFFIRTAPFRRRTKRFFLARNSSFFAKRALRALGVRVTVTGGKRLPRAGENVLIVSNHVSSLDILVLASLAPSVFVTSVELKSGPATGIIARCGGSIYVERRSVASLKKEIEEIAGVLKSGLTVVIFPEGTTSNGDRVAPFKVSLFDAAFRSSKDVLPVCLRYRAVNAKKITPENRDSVFYYGGMSFVSHGLRVLSASRVEVDALVLEPIATRGRSSRKELAAASHRVISKVYGA